MKEFELLPKHVWDSMRMVDILKAIRFNKMAGKPIPEEWEKEYKELAEKYSTKPK